MTILDKLHKHIKAIDKLLADPHPGLVTWVDALAKEWKAVADLWSGRDEP